MKTTPIKNKNGKIYVTIALTESTSSFLNLDIPHIETMDPENSKICVIKKSSYKNLPQISGEESSQSEYLSTTEGKDFRIASDLAMFSTSNCSSNSEMYDISDSDDSSSARSNFASASQLFKPTKIKCHPLVAVRSAAHSNKLKVDSRGVYITLLDSNSRISSDFMCRICHGGDSIGDLLTPCRCRGTVALVHLKCLERWLRESSHSRCELCQHHYKVIRQPKYSIPWSIMVFLRHPGPHLRDIILDSLAFVIYTPSAVASTYMLMLICEALVKSNIVSTGSLSSHIIAFAAVFGMAAIDFTYSSWLILTVQKHYENWLQWYNAQSTIKIVLPKIKLKPKKKKDKRSTTS